MLQSKNLKFYECTQTMTDLAMHNRKDLARQLCASIPESWPVPPEALPFFFETMKANPDHAGWLNYLVVHKQDSMVMGDIGFLGAPDNDGTIEIGYSVVPEYREKGYAAQMLNYMVGWAFEHHQVKKIIAQTLVENEASINLLRNAGFTVVNQVETEEGLQSSFEIRRSDFSSV